MSDLKRSPIAVFVTIVITLSVLLSSAPAALAGPPVVPMPGERFLTAAERAAAVVGMRPNERKEIEAWFGEDQPEGLVVAYTRREFRIIEQPGGGAKLEEVGFVSDNPESGLSLPSMAVAATGGKPGTDIYISVTIVRTRTTSPHEWRIRTYADWAGKSSPTGLDAFNSAEDSIGVAWAGGLYIQYDSKGGLYMPCPDGTRRGVNIYRSDATPNVGIGWSWNEWSQWLCKPHTPQAMEYVRGDVYIRETSWKYRTSNVVMKYFHTWGGSSYALSMSASGPTISIVPTSNQWSAAAYLSFSH